jgi:hypothetical protein
MYSSTCFGRPYPPPNPQELNNYSSSLWFYRWNAVIAVLLFVVGPDLPQPTTLLPPRSNGKPEAATAPYKLLMMGKKMPETCWAVFERPAINLRDWCIWLVDLFEWIDNEKSGSLNGGEFDDYQYLKTQLITQTIRK